MIVKSFVLQSKTNDLTISYLNGVLGLHHSNTTLIKDAACSLHKGYCLFYTTLGLLCISDCGTHIWLTLMSSYEEGKNYTFHKMDTLYCWKGRHF